MNEFWDFSIQDELDYFEDKYGSDHDMDASMNSIGKALINNSLIALFIYKYFGRNKKLF